MPSPTGIFTSFTASELLVLKANALAAITGGRRTSLSGGAKSGSKEWQMTPQEVLLEVKYAQQQLGIIAGRVSKTYGEFTGIAPFPVVANEQV